MFPRKDKESDETRTKTSSSTRTRRQCSTQSEDGRRCVGDGKHDSSRGKICGTCYDKTNHRTRVGTGEPSSTTMERPSRKSSQNTSPEYSTNQKNLHQGTKTTTQSHHLQAPNNRGKRYASRSPSNGPSTTRYQPVSPDLTGYRPVSPDLTGRHRALPDSTESGTSRDLDPYPTFRNPAHRQRNDFIEYEPYIPPSEFGQQKHPEEIESHQSPQSPYHPRSPDLSGFTTTATELTPHAYAAPVAEQPFRQSSASYQTHDSNREYREGDLYSADSDPEDIRQQYPMASTAQLQARADVFQGLAVQRHTRPWEIESSNEQPVSSNYDSTTTAGAEGSSRAYQTSNVSDIQSRMLSTSIMDPNVLATSDSRRTYDQAPSTGYVPSNSGYRPSSPLLPEAARVGMGNAQWRYNKQQWDQNKYAMQQQYLERYPTDGTVSENPEELCAHLLFAMSLGEGNKCNFRTTGRRCSRNTVAGKRFFLCDRETHNDENNYWWYRGLRLQTPIPHMCFQLVESDKGERGIKRRQCGRLTDSTYCGSVTHCDKNLNVPQPTTS